jgi:glycosyltransferase involved in cell wall biosynthesis
MSSNIPQVSVIIPTYNQAQYLAEAIESVLGQTYRDFEIIVVDDGSTDKTPEIAKRFGNAVRYIRQENQGLAGARNTGIMATCSNFVSLLDSDDTWMPTYLEEIMATVAQYPEATVFYCYAECMDASGCTLPQVLGGPVVPSDAMYHTLLRANFLIPSTITLRRSVIVAAGLFDETFRRLQDWELWIRLLKEGRHFVGLVEVLARYRIHPYSLSTDLTGGQRAALALAVKHFGPDDGQWRTWPHEKRRTYGGVYRYCALSSVQRQNDWQICALHLCRALQIDPTLATDLDFFYDLALGAQPVGYRGTSHRLSLDLENNALRVSEMLDGIFRLPAPTELKALRRQTFGMAYYALGLVAYNTGQRTLSRRYLATALSFRPDLWRNPLVAGNLVKSLVSPSVLAMLKKYGTQAHS